MNLLNRTRCYTVGAMQYANGQSWRVKTRESLNKLGVTVFDPYHKPFVTPIPEDDAARAELKHWMDSGQYDRVAERMKEVRSDDLRLVDLSDFFIVQIIPNVASWGSAEELSWSVRCKKPIFIFIDHPDGKRATPLWVMGQLPHKYIYNSLDEILKVLHDIDSGKKEIDSKRWRLLLPEYR